MTQGTLLIKNQRVCSLKPIFDYLQKTDNQRFLQPIEITSLVKDKLSTFLKFYLALLWNQISDPNLGLNDFLKVDETALEFKWVVVDKNIIPISNVLDYYDPTMTTIEMVMIKLSKNKKYPSYFIADGYYEGKNGIHFCLTPFNDTVSCKALKKLFGYNLIDDFKKENFDFTSLDLNSYFDSSSVEFCEKLYVDHLKKSLGLLSVPA